jgi:predicted aspartyl protease
MKRRRYTEEEIREEEKKQGDNCIFDQVRFSRIGLLDFQGIGVAWVKALVDTGATQTVVSPNVFRLIRVPRRDSKVVPGWMRKRVVTATEKPRRVIRASVGTLRGQTCNLFVSVADLSCLERVWPDVDAILGMDYLREAGAVIDVGNGAIYYGGMNGMARVAARKSIADDPSP